MTQGFYVQNTLWKNTRSQSLKLLIYRWIYSRFRQRGTYRSVWTDIKQRIWQRWWWPDFLHWLASELFVEALPCKRMPCLRATLRSRTCSWMFGLDMSPLIAALNALNYSLLYDIHKRRERWKRFSSVCSPRFIALWSAGVLTCMKNICSFSGVDVA